MKNAILILTVVLSIAAAENSNAQEKSPWTTAVDLYSSYVWRGTKLGSGPALQPLVKYNKGGFTIGGWGSYCFSTNEAAEADLFTSYAVSLGEKSSLTFLLTDYYFPGETAPYFQGTSHYFEPMVTLGVGKLALSGAYMFNAEDTYLEATYAAGPITLLAAAGNGQYTGNDGFNLCTIGVKSTTAIKLSETFSLPLNGALLLNPATEQFNIVVGITLSGQ